jgi:hypothetical protein
VPLFTAQGASKKLWRICVAAFKKRPPRLDSIFKVLKYYKNRFSEYCRSFQATAYGQEWRPMK